MSNEDIKILIVDDNETNRMCAEMNLKRFIKYSNVASQDDGITALDYLRKHPDTDIVFIDRMMLKMNGIPMIRQMNADPTFKHMVSVFQTGEVSLPEKQECIDNNALYLLQKPYDYKSQGILTNFIASLIRARRRMQDKIALSNKDTIRDNYELTTLAEVEDAAVALALNYPNPLNMYEAIYELLLNAVEHGNLELGYNKKRNFATYEDYIKEISEREKDPKNASKVVKAAISKQAKKIILTISDNGKGFQMSHFPEFCAGCIREHNGRGIYKAQKIFDTLEYTNNGSCAIATFKI
jgi:two-component system cell cycle response regulator